MKEAAKGCAAPNRGIGVLLPAFLRRGGREAAGAVGQDREALRLLEVTNRPVCTR
jgi:hypothetical protein